MTLTQEQVELRAVRLVREGLKLISASDGMHMTHFDVRVVLNVDYEPVGVTLMPGCILLSGGVGEFYDA